MWIVSGRGETQATFRSTGSFFEPVVNSMVVFKYWINASQSGNVNKTTVHHGMITGLL